MNATEKSSGCIIDDSEIIELFRQRNEKAIHMTDKKYGTLIYRIAYNILHDKSDCEECRNDVYLGLWNAIPPASPIVFPAFITQIIRRIAINRYTEKTAKKRIPSELTVSIDDLADFLHSDSDSESNTDVNELKDIINSFLADSSERERFIFIARYYIGDSIANIAADLNLTGSSVYKELSKIKNNFKLHLERNGVFL